MWLCPTGLSWHGMGMEVGRALSLTAGSAGWHWELGAWRAPPHLLHASLQMLAPGVKLHLLSGKSRRILQLSASSLAGSEEPPRPPGRRRQPARFGARCPVPLLHVHHAAARSRARLQPASFGCPGTGPPHLCRRSQPLLALANIPWARWGAGCSRPHVSRQGPSRAVGLSVLLLAPSPGCAWGPSRAVGLSDLLLPPQPQPSASRQISRLPGSPGREHAAACSEQAETWRSPWQTVTAPGPHAASCLV